MATKKKSMNDLYKELIPKTKARDEADELFTVPKKETSSDMPHYQVFKPNYMHQCDLLFLPTDKFGIKYALVIVDVNTRKCDAVGIKDKEPRTIIKAITKIYNRDILELPTVINFDSGTEFKNSDVKAFMKTNNVLVKYALPNRHRQQSLIEYKNKIIGGNLMKIMNTKEIETNKTSKSWVQYLPKLIELINDNLPKPITKPIKNEPIITKNNNVLLNEGDKVRVQLDAPKDIVSGKRLVGNFRSGDVRWSKPEKVEQLILKAGFPPMYYIQDHPAVAYTRQQLQKVNFL
jgi:hypothetical protein